MVMKRRLPSKLTQAKAVSEDRSAVTDFEMTPEDQAIFPTQTSEEPAQKQAEEPVKKTVPAEDVLEDIPERQEKPVKEASEEKILASQPAKNRMKRKVTNKRSRRRVEKEATKKQSQAQKPAPIPQKEFLESEGAHLKDMDVSSSRTQRPDAKEAVETAFATIDGSIPDPAEQEIEAAYQPTEELENPVSDSPRVDAADLINKVREEKKLSSEKEPEKPEQVEEIKEIPEADISQFDAPKPFADDAASTKQSIEDVKEETKEVEDDWVVDGLETQEPPLAPQTEENPYKDILTSVKEAETLPPPELPGSQKGMRSIDKTSPIKTLIILVVLVGVGFLGYKLFSGGDKTQERIARFTGALTEVSENIPAEVGGAQDIENIDIVQPEDMIKAEEITLIEEEARAELAAIEEAEAPDLQIEILNVDAEESLKPIVGEDSAEIPEEVGLIAGLQNAIMKEREKAGDVPLEGDKKPFSSKEQAQTPIEKLEKGLSLQKQLEEELAAYRKALMEAENPAERPKPNAFFNKLRSEEKKPAHTYNENTQDLPPSTIYTDNPYNLPIIPEPKAEATHKTRVLEDFDVAIFTPEKPRVRMPKGVQPRLRASDFPQVEILSLIPERGIIAISHGREGVLLVGEVVEGWELVSVYEGYAEFRSGTRKHVLTLSN